MERIVKVGKMPGRINEVVVAEGTTVRELLSLAELDSTGYDIKVDGETASLDNVINESTNLVLLAKQVKGNAGGVVKVGKMPGRIEEYVVTPGQTISDVLSMAGLDSTGYDIKVDGEIGTPDTKVTENTNLILLAKQVKGNAGGVVKVGKMPGRIEEYAVTPGQTISDVLSMAGLDSQGYEIKVDGEIGTLDSVVSESTNLILLAKLVKGN